MHRISRVRPSLHIARIKHRKSRCRGHHLEGQLRTEAAARGSERSDWIDEAAADALVSVGLGVLIQRRRLAD